MARIEKTYALYRGDELLIIGTAREIAESQGITRKAVWHYATPAYEKRCKRYNSRRLICLDESEEIQ